MILILEFKYDKVIPYFMTYIPTDNTQLNLKQESSTEIDKYIKRNLWSKILFVIGILLLYGSVIVGSIFDLSPKYVLPSIVLGLIFFVVGTIPKAFFKGEMGDRKLISYTLYKISEGIEKGNLKKKYIKLLHDKTLYDEEEEIRDQDYIFEEDELKTENFKKNINEFSFQLNHAINHNSLDKIDPILVKQLAELIFKRDNTTVSLAKKVSNLYLSKEKLPTTSDVIKKTLNFKPIKFVLCELTLIIFLMFIYTLIIPNLEVTFTGLFTISAAIIFVVFK